MSNVTNFHQLRQKYGTSGISDLVNDLIGDLPPSFSQFSIIEPRIQKVYEAMNDLEAAMKPSG